MPRFLCAWSPDWAIANWKRRHPSASPAEGGPPLALVHEAAGTRRLAALDQAARTAGLAVGQKAADALAIVPELRLEAAEPEADAVALLALTDWAARFSPAAAADPPDGLLLDITGVAHLWGGEAAMIADLLARLAKQAIGARAAAAETAGAARALARFAPDATTVAGREETLARLAPLPVQALRLETAEAAQLGRLGLTTIGRLAGVPRAQLARRFGSAVVTRLDRALGRAPESLTFRRPLTPWLARLAFAEPISAPADLARATTDAVARLCARLESEGRGARRFEIAFHRLDGAAPALEAGLSLAGRDPAAIRRLFLPRLERIDPGFGIEVVTLLAEDVEAIRPRQRRLDGEATIAPEDGLAPFVDRLTNRWGAAAVWRAEPRPSHLPERSVIRRPPLAPATAGLGWNPETPRPLRLLRRPEAIEVIAPIPDDPPVFFRWRGLPHRVRRAEGPERLEREWWRDQGGRARDYYRVEDEAGGRFWLFRSGLFGLDEQPSWWLHGLFG